MIERITGLLMAIEAVVAIGCIFGIGAVVLGLWP